MYHPPIEYLNINPIIHSNIFQILILNDIIWYISHWEPHLILNFHGHAQVEVLNDNYTEFTPGSNKLMLISHFSVNNTPKDYLLLEILLGD